MILIYENSIAFDKKNPKKLFTYIKSSQKVIPRINAITLGNTTFTDLKKISNLLNNQFESVFVNDNDNSDVPTFNELQALN